MSLFLKKILFVLSTWKLTLGYGNMMEPWAFGFLKHPHVGITFKHMPFAERKFTGYIRCHPTTLQKSNEISTKNYRINIYGCTC
jgi:hypothetical protein